MEIIRFGAAWPWGHAIKISDDGLYKSYEKSAILSIESTEPMVIKEHGWVRERYNTFFINHPDLKHLDYVSIDKRVIRFVHDNNMPVTLLDYRHKLKYTFRAAFFNDLDKDGAGAIRLHIPETHAYNPDNAYRSYVS